MLRDSADGLKCSTEAARAKLPISANASTWRYLPDLRSHASIQYVGALRRMHWTRRESNQIIHAAEAMNGAAGCVAQP
jgi:hypothetical protein